MSSEVGAQVVFVVERPEVDFAPYAELIHLPRKISAVSTGRADSRAAPDQLINIRAGTLNGSKIMNLQVSKRSTIQQLRTAIANQASLSASLIHVLFEGKRRENKETLEECHISEGSTVMIVLKKHEDGRLVLHFPTDFLHPQFNYTFADRDTETFTRGGRPYYRPVGSLRFALNVNGRFKDGNNSWLGTGDDAWPVSYHGSLSSFFDFVSAEVRAAGVESVTGLPTAVDPEVAWRHARQFIATDGNSYRLIFQHRVHPQHMREVQGPSGAIFFIVEHQEYIRPYGICIREDKAASASALVERTESTSSLVAMRASPSAAVSTPRATPAASAGQVLPPSFSSFHITPNASPSESTRKQSSRSSLTDHQGLFIPRSPQG